MKECCLTSKTIIAALIICVGFISAIGQIQRNTWINFYGKVVDEDNQPVTGAVIKLVIAADSSEDNVPEEKDYTTETGGDGKFSLIGAVGHALQILSITKPGYELSKKAKLGYPYLLSSDIYHPDMRAPVLFKMWKQQGKEPLGHTVWHGKVVCDGTTNRFDLISGRPSPEGKFEIVCLRRPLKSPPPGNGRFDYKFEIAVIGGGIQPAQDEFTYLAPEGNYSKSLTFSRKADDPKWDSKIPIPKEYYFKTADGRYGTLFVDWYAAQNSATHLEWNISINPSGSRNLER